MRNAVLLLSSMLLMIVAASCATHISGLQSAEGLQNLYVFENEHEAFASAYEVLVAALPDEPVKVVSGPTRGYTVTGKGLLGDDDANQYTINILPGTGRDEDGKAVAGYYVEVSVENESISGRLAVKKIYRAILENFERNGLAVPVKQIRLGKYKDGSILGDNEKTPEKSADFQASRPSMGLIAEELEKLNNLRINGGLTQTEYEALKRRLIEY